MKKVSFYHIKPRNPELLKDGTIKCVILRGKKLKEYQKHYSTMEVTNEKEYYYPISDSADGEVFIPMTGWVKTKTTKVVSIPMYDGVIDHWNDYVSKYGYACMFKSLTDYDIHTMDCCAYAMQKEFWSVVNSNWGLHKYAKFVDMFKKINELQMNVLDKIKGRYYDFTRDYLFYPSYSLGGIISIDPYCDVVRDDEKLEKLYRTNRNKELSKQGKKAIEIVDILDNEIIDGVFPVSTKERIVYLYGEECAKLYEDVLEQFKVA